MPPEFGPTSTVPATPGWLAVQCHSPALASWLCAAILEETVPARSDGARLFVPVGDHYTLTGEIKNVITVVAKTAHYWTEHLSPEVRGLLQWEARFARLKATVAGLLRR